jgi:hypothetical protein
MSNDFSVFSSCQHKLTIERLILFIDDQKKPSSILLSIFRNSTLLDNLFPRIPIKLFVIIFLSKYLNVIFII